MEVFPAIDIKGGQVVRLTQGDYDQMETYAAVPAEIAGQFKGKGAKNLHMVDLDGAKDGDIVNIESIRAIVEQGGLFTQLGGGVRDEERIRRYLELGVGRVILGTAAAENFAFLERMVDIYGERIAVGVDAKDGKIAVKGWREVTEIEAIGFCEKLDRAGVSTIIYTDIAKDGMGSGTNLEVYRQLKSAIGCDIIASGGITYLEEFAALKEIGVHGVIVGKALYTGKLRLEEVLSVC